MNDPFFGKNYLYEYRAQLNSKVMMMIIQKFKLLHSAKRVFVCTLNAKPLDMPHFFNLFNHPICLTRVALFVLGRHSALYHKCKILI